MTVPIPTSLRDHVLRTLFDRELAYVMTTLRRLGVRPADVEDAVQDVFIAVAEKLPTADIERPMRPWLCAFAFHVASNHRRRAHHREATGADAELAAIAVDGDREQRIRDAKALLDRALEEIPAERRVVFVMHDIDEISAPEIARVLDLPVNTVYSRLRVARDEVTTRVREIERGVR